MSKHIDPSIVEGKTKNPLSAWFLGPKAENSGIWKELINYIFDDYIHWRRNYFPTDPVVVDRVLRRNQEFWYDKLTGQLDSVLNELKAHYPFYSPRYIAHMLSEQSLPSVVGYFAGMLYNPNNVTSEAAPVTVPLEIEAGKMVAEMLGYNPEKSWTHICSGGTIANLEAFWVARTTQFAPLIVQEYCIIHKIDFWVDMPNGTTANIQKLSPKALLSLRPNTAISIYRNLAKYLITEQKKKVQETLQSINDFIPKSIYNISEKGLLSVLGELQLSPKLLVSEAAHYSIKKTANILGYGEDNVVKIPVDENFRVNVSEMKNLIENLQDNEYIAGVIGILGTTEEGAIDPLHEMLAFRDEWCTSKNQSFWFHIDAAWGGYMRSLMNHPDLDLHVEKVDLDKAFLSYKDKLSVSEKFDIKIDEKSSSPQEIYWDDEPVYKALLSMERADSITIDPHKLGYIPYPAGMISFKNAVVTEHIKQEAQYISDEKGGIKDLESVGSISAVGPYIIEGSKPGAAAAACYLAHKAIPLDTHGHGKIIRTTILNTKKLCKYLQQHQYLFSKIEKHLFDNELFVEKPFTFQYLYEPDSNVVCFIAKPMAYNIKGELVDEKVSLSELNELNKNLYNKLSISDSSTPYRQEFFVSRTTFNESQYDFDSIKKLLEKLNISEDEYKTEGLFVLRSTVMNPWHWNAQLAGMDYFKEFLYCLHRITKEIL